MPESPDLERHCALSRIAGRKRRLCAYTISQCGGVLADPGAVRWVSEYHSARTRSARCKWGEKGIVTHVHVHMPKLAAIADETEAAEPVPRR